MSINPQTLSASPIVPAPPLTLGGLIRETVVAGPAVNQISFPNIPQNFRDLRIVYQGRSDAAATKDDIDLTCNGDNFSSQIRSIYFEQRLISESGWNGNPTGGVFTSTPGAVSTVSIPHGLAVLPQHFIVQAGNLAARGAPSYYVTVDATNIIINFSAPLTAATAYTWNWIAIGANTPGGFLLGLGRTPGGLTSCIVGTVAAASAIAGAAGAGEVVIPNYTNTVFHKQCVSVGGLNWTYTNTDSGMDARIVSGVAVRQDVAPITQIDLYGRVGNFIAGSRFALYGT